MQPENPNLSFSAYKKLDPIHVVVIQSISLVATIGLGMVFFLSDFNPDFLTIMWLISGPIYCINLPYLLNILEKMEVYIYHQTNEIRHKLNYLQNAYPTNDPLVVSKIAAILFVLNKDQANFGRPMIQRELLVLALLSPAWPIMFYYLHYKVTKRLQIQKKNFQEVNSLMSFTGSEIRSPRTLADYNYQIHLILALFSIIGFGLTFFMFGVGFFAIYWTLFLVLELNKLTQTPDATPSYDQAPDPVARSPSSGSSQGLPFSGLYLVAFFCYGATSGFIAGYSNTFYAISVGSLMIVNPTLFILFVVAFIAPVIEESVKVSGLLFQESDKVAQWPIFYWALFGMVSGLGFGLIENYIYFQTFYIHYDLQTALDLLAMRFIFPIHMLASGMAGLGVGLWLKTKKVIYLFTFGLLAMAIHSSFNFLMTVGVE